MKIPRKLEKYTHEYYFCQYFMNKPSCNFYLTEFGSKTLPTHMANKNDYRIHSNKSPGCLDKAPLLDAQLVQYLLQGSTEKE